MTSEIPTRVSRTPRQRLSLVADWIVTELLEVHVRDGRLRLTALSRRDRTLAVIGLTVIAGLGLLLLRPGLIPDHLILLYSNGENGLGAEGVPTVIPALLIAGLCLFWILLAWASFGCRAAVPALLALAFLFGNSEVAEYLRVGLTGSSRALAIAGFLLAPAGLLAYALAARVKSGARGTSLGRAKIAARSAAVGGIALFYLTVFVTYVHGLRAAGFRPPVNSVFVFYVAVPIQYLVNNLYGVYVILLITATAATVQFAYEMARAVAGAGRRVPSRLARGVVLVLMVAEVFFIVRRLGGSERLFVHYWGAVFLVALGTALAAWLAWLFRGLFAVPEGEIEIRNLLPITAAAYAFPLVAYSLAVPASDLFNFAIPGFDGPGQPADPFSWLGQNVLTTTWFYIAGVTVPFGVLFLIGLRRADRSASAAGRRWMAGLALVSGWALWTFTVTAAAPAYLPQFVDEIALIVTAAAAVHLWRNWSKIGGAQLAFLMALITFTWLVSSGGEALDIIGRAFGLDDNVPLVFGVLLILLGQSQFTRRGSKWFPEPARPLLWIAYLGFSLLFSVWLAFTHGFSTIGQENQTDLDYFYLLIAPPFAAWLLLSGRFIEEHLPESEKTDQVEVTPVPAGEAP